MHEHIAFHTGGSTVWWSTEPARRLRKSVGSIVTDVVILVEVFLVVFFGTSLLVGHLNSDSLTRSARADLQSSVVHDSANCSRIISKPRPSFAPKNWDIVCQNLVSSDPKETRILGAAWPTAKTVGILPDQNEDSMIHTMIHEWVHAAEMERGNTALPRDTEWEKYVATLRPKGLTKDIRNYSMMPGEVLADTVARCALGDSDSPVLVAHASCEKTWALYPEYKYTHLRVSSSH